MVSVRFAETGWRRVIRRVAVTTAIVCVVTMILQAWRADAPNLLVWRLLVAVAAAVSMFTVPWVVWTGRPRVTPSRLAIVVVVTVGTGELLGLLVIAAAFADNTDRPVPWPVSLVTMLVPFSVLSSRIAASRRRVAVIGGVHLVAAVFVLDAARRCVDDDCYPLPLWYSLAGIAGLWYVIAELAPAGAFPGDGSVPIGAE
jgi:hypothetical protein